MAGWPHHSPEALNENKGVTWSLRGPDSVPRDPKKPLGRNQAQPRCGLVNDLGRQCSPNE